MVLPCPSMVCAGEPCHCILVPVAEMGSRCRRTCGGPTMSRRTRRHLRLPSPCCRLPCCTRPSFLHLRPGTACIMTCLLLVTEHLPPSACGCRKRQMCGIFSRPSGPLPSNYNSIKSSYRGSRSIQTDPRSRSLCQSFHPTRASVRCRRGRILSRFLRGRGQLFL